MIKPSLWDLLLSIPEAMTKEPDPETLARWSERLRVEVFGELHPRICLVRDPSGRSPHKGK